MENTVEYHELAKIGIKDIFYFFDVSGGKEKWKHDEKMIETIDGRKWNYDKTTNTYTLFEPKLQEV